jgi:hypothetical protein
MIFYKGLIHTDDSGVIRGITFKILSVPNRFYL